MKATGSRRLRVCFVIPSLAGGGAERVAVQVLNALDGQRWERSLFLHQRSGPFLRDLDPSIHVGSADRASRAAQWLALRAFIRQTRPDVVVAFLSYWSTLTASRAAGIGARVVFAVGTPLSSFLTDADYKWSRPSYRRLFIVAMRAACARADLIVATSEGVAEDLIASFGGARDRVHVVNNPVDLDAVAFGAREPIDPDDAARWRHPVVVAAGRLADVKNYPLLIDAFAILRQQLPASLFILGQGADEAAIRELIRSRGLVDCVHLAGYRRNPWSYMARADVFALTSRYEGFGNVIVEAMACGVPVVATVSPGTKEIVTSGSDGVLVDRHDPSAFAAALAAVLNDAGLRRQMGESARRHAERYRTDAIASTYDRLFTEVVA